MEIESWAGIFPDTRSFSIRATDATALIVYLHLRAFFFFRRDLTRLEIAMAAAVRDFVPLVPFWKASKNAGFGYSAERRVRATSAADAFIANALRSELRLAAVCGAEATEPRSRLFSMLCTTEGPNYFVSSVEAPEAPDLRRFSGATV
jgi:hypothetical protein